MPTLDPPTGDEAGPNPLHAPADAEWTPKVLLGVGTLRQMVAEAKQRDAARKARPEDAPKRDRPS